jgi:hypothetical protein
LAVLGYTYNRIYIRVYSDARTGKNKLRVLDSEGLGATL